jgi:gluconolactonase
MMMGREEMEIPVEQFETYADGLDHPEDIAFDSEGVLWAGGELGQIYRVAEKEKVETVANIGGFCLGLCFSASDELYVCNPKLGSVIKVQKNGKAELFADSAGQYKLRVPNYGVFDSAGNLYVSDSGDWTRSNGCIVRFDRQGRGVVFSQEAYLFPNGLALSADERYLFVAQSHRDNVLRIEIRADGLAGEHDVYVAGMERIPDGLAFDVQGNLYVSCYASDNIYKVSPERNAIVLSYDRAGTALARPTNIAFGGDHLYVANLGRWHIARAKVGVRGQPLANQKKNNSESAQKTRR